MRKFFAAASVFALIACGGNETEVADTEVATEEPAEAVAADSPLVGSYGGEGEDGEAWTSTINPDGTYADTVGGEVTETGRWSHEGDQVCFNPDTMEGEVADETCLTLVNVNDDGSLLMSDAEGNEMTVPKIAS